MIWQSFYAECCPSCRNPPYWNQHHYFQIRSSVKTDFIIGEILKLRKNLGCEVISCCIFRLRRLKEGSKVPRVQYELAKPRDVTVLQLSHAEQTNDFAKNGSNFALHGEHHHSLHPNESTQQEDVPAGCSNSYSVDANYGDDTTRSYNSFTSDESDDFPADNAPCEYATVNKRRAPTCG